MAMRNGPRGGCILWRFFFSFSFSFFLFSSFCRGMGGDVDAADAGDDRADSRRRGGDYCDHTHRQTGSGGVPSLFSSVFPCGLSLLPLAFRGLLCRGEAGRPDGGGRAGRTGRTGQDATGAAEG